MKRCNCGELTYYGDGSDGGQCESCYVGELEAIAMQTTGLEKRVGVLEEALEYMADEKHWYIEDKTDWMVMLRPRNEYKTGEASAYLNPWVFAKRVL